MFFYLLLSYVAYAAYTIIHPDITRDQKNPNVHQILSPEITLHFCGDISPRVLKSRPMISIVKRVNSFLKDTVKSCERALAMALLSLQQTALKHKANASIDIYSNITSRKKSSHVHYDFLVGSPMVEVAFQASTMNRVPRK